MKRLLIALLGACVIALTVVIGDRMSADAMAVVVGVVCGIGASIPTSLLMLFLLSRRQEADPWEPAEPQVQMPHITITGGQTLIMTPGDGYALDVPRMPATLPERHRLEVGR